jgi:hypothetical protein
VMIKMIRWQMNNDTCDNTSNHTSEDWFHSSDRCELAKVVICEYWLPKLSWMWKSLSSVMPSIFGKKYKIIVTNKTAELWII